MGNEQSLLESRPPLKLTKPRTFGSTPTALSPCQPLDLSSPSQDGSFDYDHIVTSTSGESRSRPEARQSLRLHLFGAEDVQTHLSEGQASTTPSSAVGNLSRTSSYSQSWSSTDALPTPLSTRGSRLSLVAESVVPAQDEAQHHDAPTEAQDLPSVGTGLTKQPTMRRRSLLTPGIATRGKPTNVLRKAPPPQQLQSPSDREYYFNPALSESSPLSWLAALDLVKDCHCDPTMRSSTPQNLDYSHLSGLKRGTLRITNGAASPVPSLRPTDNPSRCSDDVKSDDEYFSTSEGRGSPDTLLIVPPKELIATASPVFKTHNRFGSIDTEVMPDDLGIKDPLESVHTEAFSGTEERSTSQVETPQSSPGRASTFAQEYIDELPSSPYASMANPLESALLAVQSKIAAVDDELFDEGRSISRVSMGDVPCAGGEHDGGSRGDALRTLTGGNGRIPSLSSSVSSSSPRSSASKLDDVSKWSRLSSKTADSGYSSNTSLYSFPSREKIDLASSLDCSHSQSPPPQPQREAPPVPEKDVRRNTMMIEQTTPQLNGLEENIGRKSLPALETAQESLSPTLRVLPRKLQKKVRPISMQSFGDPNVITVQAQRDFEEDHIVPAVPSSVAARLVEHLKLFPTLDHTYPNLHGNQMKEDRVKSDSVILTNIIFPDHEESSDKENERRGGTGGRSQSQSRSQHRTPIAQNIAQQEDIMTAISDFGTVAGSLGSGPYDAAINAGRRQSSESASRYPHQLGGTGRPKITMGMAESTAVKLAREKSRDCHKLRSRSGARDAGRSQPEALRAQHAGDGQRVSTEERHQTPPMPSLDRAQVSQDDTRAAIDIPIIPQEQSSDQIELQLENASTTTNKTHPTDSWDRQRRLWRQRRRSASQGLQSDQHITPPVSDTSIAPVAPVTTADAAARAPAPRTFSNDFTRAVAIDANAHAHATPLKTKTRRVSSRSRHTEDAGINESIRARAVSAALTPTSGLDLRDVPSLLR